MFHPRVNLAASQCGRPRAFVRTQTSSQLLRRPVARTAPPGIPVGRARRVGRPIGHDLALARWRRRRRSPARADLLGAGCAVVGQRPPMRTAKAPRRPRAITLLRELICAAQCGSCPAPKAAAPAPLAPPGPALRAPYVVCDGATPPASGRWRPKPPPVARVSAFVSASAATTLALARLRPLAPREAAASGRRALMGRRAGEVANGLARPLGGRRHEARRGRLTRRPVQQPVATIAPQRLR